MRNGLWMGCALALTLVACDSDPMADGGVDSGPVADAGLADAGPIDAGPTDGGPSDAGPTDPCDACGSDQICVRDVCIDACGATAEVIDMGLGAGLTPVTHFCRPAAARAFHDGEVWDVTTALDGTVTTFTLSRWTPAEAGLTGLTEVGTATYDTSSADTMTFASAYLAVSPDGAHAAFGYTDSTFRGDVVVRRMGSTDLLLDANGNFDATFLDDTTLLVNGLALGGADAGQGLYAVDVTAATPAPVNVVTNLGMFSGSVVASADFVVAGGFGDAGFSRVVPRADVLAAIGGSALDAMTDGTAVVDGDAAPVSSTFTMVDGRLVAHPFGGPVTSYALGWDGSALTLSDPVVLGTDGTFGDVLDAPGDRMLLAHGGGLLLVD